MNEPTEDNFFSVPPGTMDLETEDHICHKLTISEFSALCHRLQYPQLVQLFSELNNRASRIHSQISSRSDTYDYAWKKKARAAHSIIQNKKSILRDRIEAVRSNNFLSMIRDMGWDSLHDNRLAMIRCLVNIIDNRCLFQNATTEEKKLVDLARDIADPRDRNRPGYRFDPVRHAVVSPDGHDIAVMSGRGPIAEEDGYILSRSWDMADILERCRSELLAQRCDSSLIEEISGLLSEI